MAVATNIELPRIIVRRTVATGTTIPLGTVMKLTADNTVIASSADNDSFGGIAVEEYKDTDTDLNHMSVALDGVWDIDTTAAAIPIGATVNIGAANAVVASGAADLLTGSVVGKAEEVRSGSNRIRVRVGGA